MESWVRRRITSSQRTGEDFSYDVLLPGDIVVYYTNGEPTHVGIYFGKFSSATALKQYLRKLGVPASACEAYVHDWGSNSGNKLNTGSFRVEWAAAIRSI